MFIVNLLLALIVSLADIWKICTTLQGSIDREIAIQIKKERIMVFVSNGTMAAVRLTNFANLPMKKSPNVITMGDVLKQIADFSIISRNMKLLLLFYPGGAS